MKQGVLTIEYALNVHVEDVIPPFLLRKVAVRCTPCYAGVVDEDMEFGYTLLDFGDEGIAT